MLDIQATPSPTETQDDFPRTDKAPAEGFRDRPAAQIGGGRTRLQPAAVKHLILPTDALRTAAKAHGTTVTGLLSSLLFLACASTLKGPKPDSRIQIQVPANMRKFYPSDTLRNFSMYCVLSLPYRKVTSLDAILPLVEGMLRDGTTKAALDRMATMTNDLVQNPVIRYTPLPIKRAVFRGIYRLAGENTMTTTLSNVGVVREDFGGMVERFDVVLGPAGVSRVNCAMVSYRDKAVLTLTKSTLDTRFEACLCGLIRQCGIPITLEEVSL